MSNTYSFKDVKATLVGPGGFITLGEGSAAAEEGITLTPTGDKSAMQVGADGEGIHSLYADKSGQITCRFLKNSPTNQLLSAMFAFQTSNSAAHGGNTLVVNDTNRGDVWTCTQVAFKKRPDVSYAKDADVIEWIFDAVKMEMVLGS